MADSPHSSLSTPTPASLSTAQHPVISPRAPPSPPSSDKSPRVILNSGPRSSSSSSLVSAPTTASIGTPSPSLAPVISSSSDAQAVAVSSSHSASISFQPTASTTSNSGVSKSTPTRISPRSESIQKTPATVSPSSSHYHSPLTSPGSAPVDHRTVLEDGEIYDSDSEVEIYLSSLGIDDSLSHSRVPPDPAPAADPVTEESPVLPSTAHFPEQQPSTARVTPPQPPPAPARTTIPLPDVGLERQLNVHAGPFYYDPELRSQQPSTQNFEFEDPHSIANHSIDKVDIHNLNMHDKTPNVYINGLPPHFPENQLFDLASPFGEIRSVRTFTRHVKDSESGYGFVLFETIEAAERCIMSLRRYRNLHPTFSKQVHKIPGTTYAQPSINLNSIPSGPTSSLASWEQENGNDMGDDASFKAKMESLHDPTSTNLYMEGLPLSIDEPTLAALVSPHRIVSSRFFQTRLSNPPRIIAFVRLETRAGAEEIIERLHGRMVRGWNDTGSRISVRFSDTAEQRELRRTERAAREGGEQSPARITIAQAALLNLHGPELNSQAPTTLQPRPPLPVPPLDRRLNLPRQDHARLSEYSSNAYTPSPPFTVDYSLAPGRAFATPRSQTPMHTSPYHHHAPLPLDSRAQPMDPAMATLLNSLRGNGVPFQSNNAYNGDQSTYQDRSHLLSLNRGLHAPLEVDYGMPYSNQRGATQMRSGYTATEEFIMRAHAEASAQRRRPPPLDLAHRRRDSDASVNIGVGVRGYRTQASSVAIPQQQHQQPFSPTSLMEQPLPAMNEDEFHATAARSEYRQGQVQTNDGNRHINTTKHNHRIHPAHVNARLSREHAPPQKQQDQPQNSPSLIQAPSPNPNFHYYQQAHLRSSTLPHRTSPAANQHQRHYQHSSMSIPNSNKNRTAQQQHSSINPMNKNITISDAVGIYDTDRMDGSNIHYDSSNPKERHVEPVRHYRDQNFYEIDQTSPSLVSPTLTYSSHTPSTLSPATPFFGSFGSQAEGFGRPGHGFEGKKTRAGSH